MSSKILAFLLIVLLGGMLYMLIQAEGGWRALPTAFEEETGISLPDIGTDPENPTKPPQPVEYTSGSSRYSQGSCDADIDCFVGGCSNETCGVEPDAVTTCDFSDEFPSPETHSCGCVAGHCGWTPI